MGNAERNSFVKNRITEAMIHLLERKPLADISISEIILQAQVSRNSFYRNYTDKEDIIRSHLRAMYQSWKDSYERSGKNNNRDLYCSLFANLLENSSFYLLLRDRNLFSLFQEIFLEQNAPAESLDNFAAYIVSFITYGTYGWIEEWMKRGMKETPEEMATLLAAQR